MVFWSEEEIPPGYKWEEVIEKCLRRCEIFVLIATPEALESQQVTKEVKLAQQLDRFIIPCKYRSIKNWSDLNKLGEDLDKIQGIEFEAAEDILLVLGRQPRQAIAALSQSSTVKNTIRHDIRPKTSTSNRWLAREIKRRLAEASKSGIGNHNPASVNHWLLETKSFLKREFGETHRYYQAFPDVIGPTLNDTMENIFSPIDNLNEAKEQLQDILQDIEEDKDNND